MTHRREFKRRFERDKLEAYSELCAVLDDYLDHAHVKKDYEAREGKDAALTETLVQRGWELDARANLALARIDLLAPQNICDAATKGSAVAELALDSAERKSQMEELATAMRKDLKVAKPTWTQYVGEDVQPKGLPNLVLSRVVEAPNLTDALGSNQDGTQRLKS